MRPRSSSFNDVSECQIDAHAWSFCPFRNAVLPISLAAASHDQHISAPTKPCPVPQRPIFVVAQQKVPGATKGDRSCEWRAYDVSLTCQNIV